MFHCCIYQLLCFNIIPRKNKFFFFFFCGLVLLIVLCLCIKNVWKSTISLPLNLSHSRPASSQRIMGQQILSSHLKQHKKSLEKDSIFATNHSHAIFVTKELMSSSSSLHPTPFTVQAKNFPPRFRLRVAFWRYAFGGTLRMKMCCDWMCMCVCVWERWSVISE